MISSVACVKAFLFNFLKFISFYIWKGELKKSDEVRQWHVIFLKIKGRAIMSNITLF